MSSFNEMMYLGFNVTMVSLIRGCYQTLISHYPTHFSICHSFLVIYFIGVSPNIMLHCYRSIIFINCRSLGTKQWDKAMRPSLGTKQWDQAMGPSLGTKPRDQTSEQSNGTKPRNKAMEQNLVTKPWYRAMGPSLGTK